MKLYVSYAFAGLLFAGVQAVVLPVSHAESSSAIADALPVDVQLDLLMSELAGLVDKDDDKGVVALIPRIRALAIDLPDSLYFLEARSLYRTGDALAARDRLLVYLQSEGREGRYYDQATDLLLEVKGAAEREEAQHRAEAEQRQRELAESARKARILHIREAQRKLHDLGFWLGPETGELDMASREAIAIFQVRRSLTVSGDVNEEVIQQLRAEVPESHQCDEVTSNPASPLEAEREVSQINADVAVAACNDALRRYPDVVRFQIQSALALMAAGRNEDARANLRNGADRGYPRALTWIAWMHEDGRLDEKGKPEYELAGSWYLKAADKNYPQAQYKIGDFYQSGSGVTRSDSAALQWYMKAAQQSYPIAQVAVGKMFEAGKGTKRDYVKALEWYMAASENKNAEATQLVGDMFERGRGVERDKDKAEEWHAKAASLGYRETSRR